MTETWFHRVQRTTPTRLWVNNPTPAEAARAIADGARGCTTNPTYAAKILPTLAEADRAALIAAASREADPGAGVDAIQRALVARILQVFAPLRREGRPLDGLVSIQGDPHRDTDAGHILHEAERHAALGPNVILKIPATRAGLVAIEDLLARGLPVLATEMMSVAQTRAVIALYRRVVERTGRRPPLITTHITGIYDEWLAQQAAIHAPDLDERAVASAGWLVARRVRAVLDEAELPIALMGGGARAVRHFADMVGGDLLVTINPDMIAGLVVRDEPVAERFAAPIDAPLVARLRDRLPGFRRAWDDDGLAPEEFEAFGPVRHFLAMFTKGWDAVRDQLVRHGRAVG